MHVYRRPLLSQWSDYWCSCFAVLAVDDDSDADNEVAVTRDQLKKQAQQLRDLQNKKKKKKKEDGAS